MFLFLVLEEKLPPLSGVLTVRLPFMTIIMLRYVSSISKLGIFIMNGFEILSNGFFASLEMIKMFLYSIKIVYCVNLLHVAPSLHPKEKSHFIVVNDPINVLLHSVC